MAQPQIFEGTFEELIDRKAEFAGMRLQVFAIPEEDDLSVTLPAPPNTIRDQDHLESLLLEGLNSPQRPVTDQTWEDIRREVRRRRAAGKQE